MNRQQLEYAIREVGRRLKLDYFYVIGSAAVFASIPDAADAAVTGTRDVDVIPSPADTSKIGVLADQIDFVLGEGSDFDNENGFYIQGVDNSTPAFAPKNWQQRVIPIRTGGVIPACAWKSMFWHYPSMERGARKTGISRACWPKMGICKNRYCSSDWRMLKQIKPSMR
ncbi:MAG TPA: hypothetical protein VNF48_07965 [Gammaproteobacteria bacterium]|nr:hypothetical protein [Gammaproteobacteria bacterium]